MNTQEDYDLFLSYCENSELLPEGVIPTLEQLNEYGIKITSKISEDVVTRQCELDENFLEYITEIYYVSPCRILNLDSFEIGVLSLKVRGVFK